MLKFVEGENPLISILKFLKPVSCHKLKINLFVICCEKWKLYFRFNYIFLIACEVLMCMLLRKEWGIRVCGDMILFDFWCSFAEICHIEILQNLKQFAVISMRFSYIILGGVYTYFCAVLWCSCPPYASLPPESQRRWQIEYGYHSKVSCYHATPTRDPVYSRSC